MFCQNCGANLPDDNSKFCPNCGKQVSNSTETQYTNENTYQNPVEKPHNPQHDVSKAVIGFVCAFFLGLIGLIIGICLYPEGTVARKTFIKGWLITFVITFVVSMLLCVLLLVLFVGVLDNLPSYYEVILPFLA